VKNKILNSRKYKFQVHGFDRRKKKHSKL